MLGDIYTYKTEIINAIKEIVNEEGEFDIRGLTSYLFENTCGYYEYDRQDINEYSEKILQFLTKEGYCKTTVKGKCFLKITKKTKLLINYIEPKRIVTLYSEMDDISDQVFDLFNSDKVVVEAFLLDLVSTLDIKYTEDLLEEVIGRLKNSGLIVPAENNEKFYKVFYLTDEAKKIKKVGTIKQFQKRERRNKCFKEIKSWGTILIALFSLIASIYAIKDNKNEKNRIDAIQLRVDFFQRKVDSLELKVIKSR